MFPLAKGHSGSSVIKMPLPHQYSIAAPTARKICDRGSVSGVRRLIPQIRGQGILSLPLTTGLLVGRGAIIPFGPPVGLLAWPAAISRGRRTSLQRVTSSNTPRVPFELR